MSTLFPTKAQAFTLEEQPAEPVKIDGMDVLFDQPVALMPTELVQSTPKARRTMAQSAPNGYSISYDASWSSPQNPFAQVLQDLRDHTSLDKRFFQGMLNRSGLSLTFYFREIPDFEMVDLSEKQVKAHRNALAVTKLNVARDGTGWSQDGFVENGTLSMYVNPNKLLSKGKTLNTMGQALTLIHECAHVYVDSTQHIELIQGGERTLADKMRPDIEELLLEFTDWAGKSIRGVKESFANPPRLEWQINRSELLSYYGLFNTIPGRDLAQAYSKKAFGHPLKSQEEFTQRVVELQDRIFTLVRNENTMPSWGKSMSEDDRELGMIKATQVTVDKQQNGDVELNIRVPLMIARQRDANDPNPLPNQFVTMLQMIGPKFLTFQLSAEDFDPTLFPKAVVAPGNSILLRFQVGVDGIYDSIEQARSAIFDRNDPQLKANVGIILAHHDTAMRPFYTSNHSEIRGPVINAMAEFSMPGSSKFTTVTEDIIAHEIGHALGLYDKYLMHEDIDPITQNTVCRSWPISGFEYSLMGAAKGSLSHSDVLHIVYALGSVIKKVKPGEQKVMARNIQAKTHQVKVGEEVTVCQMDREGNPTGNKQKTKVLRGSLRSCPNPGTLYFK